MTTADIIQVFFNNHYELYKAMKTTEHGYLDIYLNPYHMEGSIWNHTLMVLKETERKNMVQRLAALCHDLGKVVTVNDNYPKARRSFYNHESVSVFLAVDVLKSFAMTKDEKDRILIIVANHGKMYTLSPEKIITKYSRDDLEDLLVFSSCDNNGRITNIPKKDREIEPKDSKVRIKPHQGQPKVTVLVGPPYSGKSTWTSENVTNQVVISRDAALLKKGREQETYTEIWNRLSQEEQKEIDQEINQKYQKAVKDKRDIIIDMTNMGYSRRKWLPQGYYKEAVVFIESLETLLSRRTPEKNIPNEVIEDMMKRFQMPDYSEFDKVEIND